MVLQNHQISPQYLNKNQVTVTLLQVLNPVHFVVKESPSLDGSFEAKNFIEAEEAMQKYYESVEPCFFQLPLKDTIIVAFVKDKFYRAKVIRILTLSAGHLFKVYLVDYGLEFSVPRECIYEIAKDFLGHPFQAVNFKLLGIEPVSLIMSSEYLTMSYGPVSHWDPSAEKFVHDLQKEMCNAYIEIQANDEKHIYGKLFICYGNNITKCVNDELISNKFAHFNENCSENVQKVSSSVGIANSESESSGDLESLNYQESTSTQISSQSSCSDFEPDFNFKMKFVSPTDGRIVAESSLTECTSPTENDLQSKFVSPSDGRIDTESSLTECSSPAENDLQSKVCVEKSELSSPPVSEAISEEQSIAQKKFLKLQQLHRKQLRSPISARNDVCHTGKSLPTVVEHTVNSKVSPSTIPPLLVKQPLVEASSNDSEKSFGSETISPKSVSSTDKSSNLDEKSNVSKNVIQASPKENGTEPQTVGQLKLLKLQQLRRKQLISPIRQNNDEIKSIKSPVIENAVNLKESAVDVCTETNDKSASEVHSKPSEDTIVKLNKLDVSCDTNNNSTSSFQTNVSVSAVAEDNLGQESMTEDQLIAHKRFQKLQKLCRKKLKSPTQDDSTKNKSLLTGSENEANITNVSIESTERKSDISPKSLSSDCLKTCQSSIPNNCVKAPSENSSKQENTSEVVLEHVKTLQRLQNRVRMKKMKSALQFSDEPLDVKKISTNTAHQSSSSSSLSSSLEQICSEPSTERSQVPLRRRVPVISPGFIPHPTPLFVPQ